MFSNLVRKGNILLGKQYILITSKYMSVVRTLLGLLNASFLYCTRFLILF